MRIMNTLENGLYGVFKGGTLKKYAEIKDSEIKDTEFIVVKKDHTAVAIDREDERGYYSEEWAVKPGGYRLPTRKEIIDIMDLFYRDKLKEFMIKAGYEPFDASAIYTCEEYPNSKGEDQWAYVVATDALMPYYKKIAGRLLYVRPFEGVK